MTPSLRGTSKRHLSQTMGMALGLMGLVASSTVNSLAQAAEFDEAKTQAASTQPTASTQPAASDRQVPASVQEARRKFKIVAQKTMIDGMPAEEYLALHPDFKQPNITLSHAVESALTADADGAPTAQLPAGSRGSALSQNAAASANYAGRQRATLRGIRLVAAPYLADEARTGLTRGAEEKLAALGGREVTAALLQRALNEVTHYYREQGFLGAQAYFPVQSVDDGVLSMVVASPVLNSVELENKSGVRTSYLEYLLGDVSAQEGKPIEHEELNRKLLKLTDLGIFSLSGEFSANDVHGLSHNLALEAKPQRDQFEFSVFTDNEGTESSGRYRFGVMADVINLTGSADRLALFYARTDEQQNNYSINYELPFNSHPTVLGLSFCYSNYELSQAYEVLGAQGHEYNGEIYLKEPVYRSATAKAMWRSGLRYSDLTDEFATFDLEFKKHSIVGYTELSGYRAFPHDHTVFSYRGRLSYGSMFNDDEFELADERNFVIANIDLGFSQWWTESISYSSNLQLQFANTPLDSSEQMQAGGSYVLRAYQSSDLVGDSGVIWSNALHFRLFTNDSTTQDKTDSTRSYENYWALTLSPHIEFAKVYERNSYYGPDSGTSAGITLNFEGYGLNAELDFSHSVGTLPIYSEKEGRISFAISYTF